MKQTKKQAMSTKPDTTPAAPRQMSAEEAEEEWVEVEVYLEEELAEVISERAAAAGVSGGEVIREAVLRYMDELEGVEQPAWAR